MAHLNNDSLAPNIENQTPNTTLLRGICWDHTRGLVPLVAAAQRFHELHPNVEIVWQKRSLRSFGETSLRDLCQEYDLLIVDHPFCGEAASSGCLAPLDQHMDPRFLEDCRRHAVGPSYESYLIDSHLWALPIDVACPIAAYREDLLEAFDLEPPRDWSSLLELARQGHVIFPGIDTDAILHLFALSLAFDDSLFAPGTTDQIASRDALVFALKLLKELAALTPEHCLDSNPIAILDELAQSEIAAYCPFAFGYSNYSRNHYAPRPLTAGPPPLLNEKPLRTVLGGAGLALSSFSKHLATAAAFAQFCMAPNTQRGLYAFSGGQPSDRRAWTDPELNRHTRHFFSNTLSTIERAYLRPRYPGFIPFQQASGIAVNRFLKKELSLEATIDEMNTRFRNSNPIITRHE